MWGFGAAWLNGLQDSFSEDYYLKRPSHPTSQIPHSHGLKSSCPHQILENFYLGMQPLVASYFQYVYFHLFQNIFVSQKSQTILSISFNPLGPSPSSCFQTKGHSSNRLLKCGGDTECCIVPFCAWLVDRRHGPMTCRASNLEGRRDCRIYGVLIIRHITGQGAS